MKFLKLCTYVASCIVIVLGSKKNYFWLEYKNKIPEKAIAAGTDKSGHTIYVGKTNKFVQDIPGYIDPSTNELFIVRNEIVQEIVNEEIMILCANHPEQMEWVTITKYNFRHILYLNIVMGGSQMTQYFGEYPFIIGRHTSNEGLFVGGVSTYENEMKLYASNGAYGKKIPMEQGFELLTFNPYLPIDDQCTRSLMHSSEGYSWINYFGTIPRNAVPGGTRPDGTVTYIGKAYFNATIVPGNLDPIKKLLYFVVDGRPLQESVNVQILCANNPKDMEWVDVTTTTFWFQWEKHIVLGGHAGNFPYIVGRKQFSDRQIVGAAVTYGYEAILNFVNDGQAKSVHTFQILTYVPNLPDDDRCSDNPKNKLKYCNVVLNVFNV